MNTQLYTLRWRGKESGPHTWSVLERMLEENEICIWHEVLEGGRWIPVGELLPGVAPTPASATTLRHQGLSSPTTAPSGYAVGGPRRTKLPLLHPLRGGGRS
ncbi:MAG: hypothetical protein BWX48_02881 [Verrucomicrobia bacterium ADurb.Bin006]|jgi:hypothetical protein|nr:hypothetical protein [Verrucomicrobiota bacterium]OQC64146.1 MAG: hypothetical protein BWX48_02881 [Verrucomicrobia bacterium ADurb.Bin006]